MKLKVMALALVLVGCASSDTKVTKSEAPELEFPHKNLLVHNHKHKHGKNCGHKRVKHDNHWDYLHKHEYHHAYNNHVFYHGREAVGRNVASKLGLRPEVKHKDHSHKHGKNCGHKRVKHGDHWDYLHGSHYHHGNKEHGIKFFSFK